VTVILHRSARFTVTFAPLRCLRIRVTETALLPLLLPAAPVLALLLALMFQRTRVALLAWYLGLAAALWPWLPGASGLDMLVLVSLPLLLVPEPAPFALRTLVLALLPWPAMWLLPFLPAVEPHSGVAGAWPMLLGWTVVLVALGQWFMRGGALHIAIALALGAMLVALFPGAVARGWSAQLAAATASVILVAGVLMASYRMAFHDALTGLPNRRALDETLARLGGHFALAMVDVDHFKRFNDRYGHEAGDRVLKRVADRLQRTRGARAFRFGGEEFCLLFTGGRTRQAQKALEATREAIAFDRVRLPGPARARGPREAKVTISIGLAERDGEKRQPNVVREAADRALYRAKSKGRNRLVLD
jgi:diguanylate cyclase (GGDEF)-like protein